MSAEPSTSLGGASMRGRVLSYQDIDAAGVISGADGNRYPFSRTDLQGGIYTIHAGAEVDFQVVDGRATSIYIVPGSTAVSGSKSKIAAALLAFFLGGIGIHKFYLGRTGAGIIMLLGGTVGWITFGVVPGIIWLIALIEFIIYLTKSDQQFEQDYVVGSKSWF